MRALFTLLAAMSCGDARAQERPVELIRSQISWGGGTREILRYEVGGLPVEGVGTVRDLNLPPRKTASLTPVWTVRSDDWSVQESQALAIARQAATRVGREPLWAPRAQRVWWPVGQTLHAAWAVEVGLARPLATWRWVVDAQTGELLDMRRTSSDGMGSVYADNPILGDVVQEPLVGLVSSDSLVGDYVAVASCTRAEIDRGPLGFGRCYEWAPLATPSSEGDYLYSPAPPGEPDPFAEVSVYYHVDAVARLFDERFGVRHHRTLSAYANFEMANAFYGDFDGDTLPDIAFGEDTLTGVDLAYDGDVVKHEYGHAVVGAVSYLGWLSADRYGMEWAGGSLNEGLADAVAIALTGDPQMGEYAGTAFGEAGAIRDLEADRRCPDDLYGEFHADGEILGALFWNLIENPAVGPDRALALAVGAASTWMPDEDWSKAGESLIEAATQLQQAGELDDVALQVVLDEVQRANLVDCGRVADIELSEPRRLLLIGAGLRGDFERFAAGVQLRVAVPPGASALRVRVEGAEDAAQGWSLTWRAGQAVEHEVRSVAMLGLAGASPSVYDGLLDGQGVGELDIPVGETLREGDALYLALAARTTDGELLDFHMDEVHVIAEAVYPEPPPEEGGGCSCSTGAGGGGVGALGLALVALFRRRGMRVRAR